MSEFSRFPAALALVATVSLPISALALDTNNFNFSTTGDLYQICSAEGTGEGVVESMLACRSFLEATVQYHDAVSDRKKMKRLICYPGSATVEDARVTFLAWAGENKGDAKLMGELPVVGVVRALAKSYPCPK